MQCDTLEYDKVQNYMQFHSLNFFHLGHVMTKPVFGLAKQDFQPEKLAGILKDWTYKQNLCTVTLFKPFTTKVLIRLCVCTSWFAS